MITREQSADAYNRYVDMVMQGADPMTAYHQSGLGKISRGIAGRQTSAQSKAGMGQIAGLVGGKLGTQAIKDVIAGEKVLGGLRGDLSTVGQKLSGIFNSTPSADQAITNLFANAPQNVTSVAGAVPPVELVGAERIAGGAVPPAQGGMFAPGSALSSALGVAGVGLGAYGAFKGIEKGDPISAGLGGAGVAGGLTGLGLALGPIGWAGLIAAPVIGALITDNKVTTRERNKRQTEHLLDIGFSKEQLQSLGRLDAEGRPQFLPDTQTKEERDASANEWKRLTSSADPNENPFRIPTAMWGYEGMLSTYGPEYLNNMGEFDRYMATAAAIESGGGFYSKKGEVLLKDQEAAKAAYEAAKNDPNKYAEYQARYENWKNTGKDTGFDWTDVDRQYGNFKAGDVRTASKNVGSGDRPNYQQVNQIFDGKKWIWQEPTSEATKQPTNGFLQNA